MTPRNRRPTSATWTCEWHSNGSVIKSIAFFCLKISLFYYVCENSQLGCLCRNNLYGTAMCESLPAKEFDFMNGKKLAIFDFLSVPDDSSEGYILKVDL